MGGKDVNSTNSSGFDFSNGAEACSSGVVSNPQSSIVSTSWDSLTIEGSYLIVAEQFWRETETFETPSSDVRAEVTDLTQDWHVMPRS